MDNLEDRQRRFLQKFLDNSARVLQNGFAYVFAHPNLIPPMDCQLQKIRTLEKRQERSLADKSQYLQALRHAYIEYIAKLTSYGLKHARCNPESLDHVAMLQSTFDEYEQLRDQCRTRKNKPAPDNRRPRRCAEEQAKIYQHHSSAQRQEDQVWDRTLQEISELHKKIDALGVRMRTSEFVSSHAVPKNDQHEGSQDNLVKFNEYLKTKLRVLKEDKKNKQRENQRKSRGNKKTVNRQINTSDDSDYNSSEVMLSFQEFEKPLTESTARVRNIERHLVIPVEADETPKITPRVHIRRSPIDGSMQLDLKLKFEDGVMFQDKFVNGFCIQNALPGKNFPVKSINVEELNLKIPKKKR